MQGRLFERVTELFENKRAICGVRALSCVCTFFNDFPYGKEDENYVQYERGLLANPRSPIVPIETNDLYREDHVIDSSGFVPVAN